jgi:hypothetical protein
MAEDLLCSTRKYGNRISQLDAMQAFSAVRNEPFDGNGSVLIVHSTAVVICVQDLA